ncbi:hypothetical protein L1887_03372 [Cichorium endivia]|nr:hypothetical protein L1887_03372 [Cichorium endivia]
MSILISKCPSIYITTASATTTVSTVVLAAAPPAFFHFHFLLYSINGLCFCLGVVMDDESMMVVLRRIELQETELHLFRDGDEMVVRWLESRWLSSPQKFTCSGGCYLLSSRGIPVVQSTKLHAVQKKNQESEIYLMDEDRHYSYGAL